MIIAVFLEDAGHAEFIGGLIERLLAEEGADGVELLERNRAGGAGATLTSLRGYLRDVGTRDRFAEVIVCAIDGNCTGWRDKVRAVTEIVSRTDYAGRVVCAIPDPHVELWYLADRQAVRRVTGGPAQSSLPAYKCEPDRYKELLRAEFLKVEIDPPAGGAEYGRDIAEVFDIGRATRDFESFDSFIRDLRGAIREVLAVEQN